jgi:hypothetical protein
MPSEQQLQELKIRLAEIADLNHASALLGWDQQTYMPAAGAEDRGNQLATLGQIAHVKFVSDEIGKLLDDLQPYVSQLDPDSLDACLVKVTRRNFDKEIKVPTELVMEIAIVTTAAHEAWATARANNDFAHFQPHLEKVLDLARRYAGLFAPYDHIYDPMVDIFEPGLKTADIKTIFNALRPQQVELIKKIASRPQVDDSFLHLTYDEQKQWDFGVEIITKMGFDCASPLASTPITSPPPCLVPCTKPGMPCTRWVPTPRSPALHCKAGLPRVSTNPSPACGRTWSVAPIPSGSVSTRACRKYSPPSSLTYRWMPSTRASTRSSHPSSGWKLTKPPITCTSCCAWSWRSP